MIFYLIAAIVLVFILVIAARTINFKPKEPPRISDENYDFDEELATKALAKLIKCKTISYNDHSLEDDVEFNKLIKLLPSLYPNVFKACKYIELPDRAILFHWKGKNNGDASVLMSHYDVVPVDEDKWDKAPFEAIIEKGELWGRGSLDTKATFNGILFATNYLISSGYQPENDIYLAFSGGEEVNGKGAPNIVNYFIENDIKLAMVLDEGGAVVEDVFPGVSKPIGLIGIAEKGMMNVQYKTVSEGGHASAPKAQTPIGILSKACAKIENNPFKANIEGPARQMFDTLGRHSSLLYRIIFANMWCFSFIIDLLAKKSGGEMNALIRTTVAFTQMEGSKARNVLPTEATMVSNIRLNPKDSIESALKELENKISDKRIELKVLEAFQPSPISEIDCPAWDKVASALAGTWEGVIVSPYLMVQCSDSRHYGKISNHVYRFSAMALTKDERATIHGNNERIPLKSIGKAVEFFIRVIKQC